MFLTAGYQAAFLAQYILTRNAKEITHNICHSKNISLPLLSNLNFYSHQMSKTT